LLHHFIPVPLKNQILAGVIVDVNFALNHFVTVAVFTIRVLLNAIMKPSPVTREHRLPGRFVDCRPHPSQSDAF
jgi:hypothetical protein